jgi:hypothetical protein
MARAAGSCRRAAGDCSGQEWPQLIVQNLTFEDGCSGVRQTATSFYGGAIYAEGGQLTVASSRFTGSRSGGDPSSMAAGLTGRPAATTMV